MGLELRSGLEVEGHLAPQRLLQQCLPRGHPLESDPRGMQVLSDVGGQRRRIRGHDDECGAGDLLARHGEEVRVRVRLRLRLRLRLKGLRLGLGLKG